MHETIYRAPTSRLVHHYGPNVHILSDPWALSAVARLGSPETPLLAFHGLLQSAFWQLARAASEQLPLVPVVSPTRMKAIEPRADYVGAILDPKAPVVVVDIARAGMVPSHLFQLALMEVLDDEAVRVDHIYMQRVSDPETGGVTGVALSGSKIGGPVAGRTLIVPDPMGATGSSIAHVLRFYNELEEGVPRRLVCCHLIVTPEYIKRITSEFPDAVIYALRLDRGLSDADVLETVPGTYWERERGLNYADYIVPGAGGLGEVINNAYV